MNGVAAGRLSGDDRDASMAQSIEVGDGDCCTFGADAGVAAMRDGDARYIGPRGARHECCRRVDPDPEQAFHTQSNQVARAIRRATARITTIPQARNHQTRSRAGELPFCTGNCSTDGGVVQLIYNCANELRTPPGKALSLRRFQHTQALRPSEGRAIASLR